MIRLDNQRIRQTLLAQRKALSDEEVLTKSKAICARCLPYCDRAATVGMYWPINREVDLTSLLMQDDVRFVLPHVISQTEMEMRQWHPGCVMKRSAWGILEPTEGEVIAPQDFTVLLIPLLAFRHDGARLGYGGGYYDRYLCHTSALKIGIAYAFQHCEELMEQPHDVRMDLVITETECILGKHR